MTTPVRVLIAEDDKEYRSLVKGLLDTDPTITVVDAVENGEEALAVLKKHDVDVALLDVAMPVMDGIETTRRISEEYPDVAVIILTSFDRKKAVDEAILSGAQGVVTKDEPLSRLVEKIHQGHQGEFLMGPRALEVVLSRAKANLEFEVESKKFIDKFNKLSPRLKQVTELVGVGREDDEIARELDLKEQSIRSYVSQILNATGYKNRYDLNRGYQRSGLADEK